MVVWGMIVTSSHWYWINQKQFEVGKIKQTNEQKNSYQFISKWHKGDDFSDHVSSLGGYRPSSFDIYTDYLWKLVETG